MLIENRDVLLMIGFCWKTEGKRQLEGSCEDKVSVTPSTTDGNLKAVAGWEIFGDLFNYKKYGLGRLL